MRITAFIRIVMVKFHVETRAKNHLMEIIIVAHRVNRLLVIPYLYSSISSHGLADMQSRKFALSSRRGGIEAERKLAKREVGSNWIII